jgi:hypothetical protein
MARKTKKLTPEPKPAPAWLERRGVKVAKLNAKAKGRNPFK